MSDIILDENGNSIFGDPAERLAEIEQILQPKLADIKNKIDMNNRRDFPQKLNFLPAITNILDANLRKRPLVRYDYAVQIDRETLQAYANAFFDLLIFIREYVPEYIANKQTFCAFASMAVPAFNQLRNSNDGDIVAITDNFSDSFDDSNMTSAQGGTTNATATFNRMRARGIGQDAVLKADEQAQTNNNVLIMDNETVRKQLNNLFGGKFLGKGK